MNWFRITVLLLFFSQTNTIYSQVNNIIPTPKEQIIKNGFMLIENNPEIITYDKFNSAEILLKNAINELNLDNDGNQILDDRHPLSYGAYLAPWKGFKQTLGNDGTCVFKTNQEKKDENTLDEMEEKKNGKKKQKN